MSQVFETTFDDDRFGSPDIEFYRGTKDNTDRVGILKRNPIMTFVHYIEGEGYFVCGSERDSESGKVTEKAPCCEREGAAKPRFGVPIVVYGTKKDGTPKKPVQWDVMVWFFSADKFSQLRPIKAEFGDLDKYDLGIQCSNEDFQRLNITPKREAIWRAKPEMQEEIEAEAEKVLEVMPKMIGKRLSLNDWKAKYDQPLDDFEDEDDEDGIPTSEGDVDIDDLL